LLDPKGNAAGLDLFVRFWTPGRKEALRRAVPSGGGVACVHQQKSKLLRLEGPSMNVFHITRMKWGL
jgi:hypothetical protein